MLWGKGYKGKGKSPELLAEVGALGVLAKAQRRDEALELRRQSGDTLRYMVPKEDETSIMQRGAGWVFTCYSRARHGGPRRAL